MNLGSFSVLPREVLAYMIAYYWEGYTLLALRRCSHATKEFADSNNLWKRLYIRDWGYKPRTMKRGKGARKKNKERMHENEFLWRRWWRMEANREKNRSKSSNSSGSSLQRRRGRPRIDFSAMRRPLDDMLPYDVWRWLVERPQGSARERRRARRHRCGVSEALPARHDVFAFYLVSSCPPADAGDDDDDNAEREVVFGCGACQHVVVCDVNDFINLVLEYEDSVARWATPQQLKQILVGWAGWQRKTYAVVTQACRDLLEQQFGDAALNRILVSTRPNYQCLLIPHTQWVGPEFPQQLEQQQPQQQQQQQQQHYTGRAESIAKINSIAYEAETRLCSQCDQRKATHLFTKTQLAKKKKKALTITCKACVRRKQREKKAAASKDVVPGDDET